MKNLNLKDYILVSFQVLIFAFFVLNIPLVEMNIPEWLKIAALMVIVVGAMMILLAIIQLNKNLSPFPTPKSDSELVQNGLYEYIRHPIYTGILLGFLGYAIYSGSLYRILVTLGLFVLFHIKSRYEEKRLRERYSNYAAYQKKTGRFFPIFFEKKRS